MSNKRARVSQFEMTTMDVDEDNDMDDTIVTNADIITLTRYMLLKRMITEEELKDTYRKVFKDDRDAGNIANVIADIKKSLEETRITVIATSCELTNNKYYLVIPTYFRPTQVWPNSLFSDAELNLIKTLISEIIVSNVGLVTFQRVVQKHKYTSIPDAKRVFEKLMDMKYLIELREDQYTLSILAATELEPYIQFTYKDTLKKCVFCRRTMFVGGYCMSCKANGHINCAKKYGELMKGAFKCLSCNKEWSRNANEDLDEILARSEK